MYVLSYSRANFGYYDTITLGIYESLSQITDIIGEVEEPDGAWGKRLPREDDEDDFYGIVFLEINTLYNKDLIEEYVGHLN